MNCPFNILGLPYSASLDQVNSQWKKLIRLHHPDKNPGRLEEAKEVSQDLNDARDRAVAQCEYRQELEEARLEAVRRAAFETIKKAAAAAKKAADAVRKMEADAKKKRVEEAARRKEEEAARREEEEAARREEEEAERNREEKRKLEEKKKLEEKERKAEEKCDAIFDTIFSHMRRSSSISDQDGNCICMDVRKYRMEEMAHMTGGNPLYATYSTLYLMADKINDLKASISTAKTNKEKLEFANRERELKLEREIEQLKEKLQKEVEFGKAGHANPKNAEDQLGEGGSGKAGHANPKNAEDQLGCLDKSANLKRRFPEVHVGEGGGYASVEPDCKKFRAAGVATDNFCLKHLKLGPESEITEDFFLAEFRKEHELPDDMVKKFHSRVQKYVSTHFRDGGVVKIRRSMHDPSKELGYIGLRFE